MSCPVSPYVFGNRNRHYNFSCGVSIGQYDGALTVFTRIFSETKGKEGMNTLVTFEYDTLLCVGPYIVLRKRCELCILLLLLMLQV